MEAINALGASPALPDPQAFRSARSEKAFRDFEAIFMKELIKEMRKSVPDDGLFEKTPAMESFEEMLDGVYADAMADSGQFGIAQQIAEQTRVQEQQFLSSSERFMENRALAPLKDRIPVADKL